MKPRFFVETQMSEGKIEFEKNGDGTLNYFRYSG